MPDKIEETQTSVNITNSPPANSENRAALWMPPGSVRGIIAISMVMMTGVMLFIIITSVFNIEEAENGVKSLNMATIPSDVLMAIMGFLTTWFTLLGLVLKAYFDTGDKTDVASQTTKILRNGKL